MKKLNYLEILKSSNIKVPKFHVVMGSGFGEALKHLSNSEFIFLKSIPFAEVQGLVAPTVVDHNGSYELYEHLPTKSIYQFQKGRLHGYEGHAPKQVVKTVMIPREAGVNTFILTNAAGGLYPQMNPGDPMVISDHMNLTGLNPLIGENPKRENGEDFGPRFPDVSELYNKKLQSQLMTSLRHRQLNPHIGAYIGVLGPNFETPFEVKLFQSWGLGAVGMSTVWEALALSHSGAEIGGVSLISNLGAGLSPQKLEHHSIVETCRKSATTIMMGIVDTLIEKS